MYEALK